jgi:hypothetical protein
MIFTVSVIIMLLTIVFVWLFGLGTHRSLFENSIISTWILTTALYAFLFAGLYMGFKLKDNLGKVVRRYPLEHIDSPFSGYSPDSEWEAIILLILMSGTILLLLINIIISLWMGILIFMAMLYWIYYRAIRFAFKWSHVCKGRIGKSLLYGLLFTLFYSVWFYGIIIGAHYLRS